MLSVLSPILLLLLILLIVSAVFFGLLLLRRSEDDPLSARINEYAGRDEQVSIEEIEMSMPLTDRVLLPVVRRVSDFVVRLAPQSMLENTARQMELAGWRRMNAATFWAIRGFLAIVLTFLFFFLFNGGRTFFTALLYALILGIVGFLLPQLFLRSAIQRRQQAIQKKLPDALDLMTICVDAGLTFDGAMARVDEKWEDPLAREFGRVIQEMRLGKSRRQALRDMQYRMDVADVTSFVASVLQADQLGVSIGRVLRIQSEQMRLRRRQRAEERAQQASIKMLFPLVFLIFPSMFLVLLGPATLQVWRSGALEAITGG